MLQKESPFDREEYRVELGTAFHDCYRTFSVRDRRLAEQSIVLCSDQTLLAECGSSMKESQPSRV